MNPTIEHFFDPATFTYSYIVADPGSRTCAVIDPVLDIDLPSGGISSKSADALIAYIRQHDLKLEWILETHIHADHLTASQYLKEQLGGRTAVGRNVTDVQETFGKLFNAGEDFLTDGSQFDVLLTDGDCLKLGEIEIQVMATPGHTPACVTFLIGDAAFVGDTLFMPDYGTARTDFPGGDAATLFASIQKILALPEDTTLYMCHDYLPADRDAYECRTTVAAEKENNIHIAGKDQQAFVTAREARDKGLAAPKLLLPSIQVNMRAGELPQPEDNEMRYLKIPLRVKAA